MTLAPNPTSDATNVNRKLPEPQDDWFQVRHERKPRTRWEYVKGGYWCWWAVGVAWVAVCVAYGLGKL